MCMAPTGAGPRMKAKSDVEAVCRVLFGKEEACGKDERFVARQVMSALRRRGWKDAATWVWVLKAADANRGRLDALERHITRLRCALAACEMAKELQVSHAIAEHALTGGRP